MQRTNVKREVMFAWLDQEEIAWLYILEQLDDRKDEMEIANIAEGLNRMQGTMTIDQSDKCGEALRGLCEEGLIDIGGGDTKDLNIDSLVITRRGRKILAEAKVIWDECGAESSVSDKSRTDEDKKSKLNGETILSWLNTATSIAANILQCVYVMKG